MTAQELLRACRERGVHLRVQGGVHTEVHTQRLHVRAPRGSLTPELREALRKGRDAVLAVLQSGGDDAYVTPSADAAHVHTLTDGPVVEQREDAVAWRLYSRLLDCELWLVRDNWTRDELVTEGTDLPVLLLDEVPYLAGKPPELLKAVLRTKRAFPSARWAQ